jgi:hypothetical protein
MLASSTAFFATLFRVTFFGAASVSATSGTASGKGFFRGRPRFFFSGTAGAVTSVFEFDMPQFGLLRVILRGILLTW